MIVAIGREVALRKHATEVLGICQGVKVDSTGELSQVWIEGFYSGFDIGPTDADWKVMIEDGEI